MTDVLDLVHTKVHAIRMIPNYKPSIFEQELNRIIAEEYKDDCSECKERLERLKYAPIPQQKGFLARMFSG